MPLSKDRELIQIISKARRHLQRRQVLRKRMGLSFVSITAYVSDLILSQPLPSADGNGEQKAHFVGQPQPSMIITGEVSGVMAGSGSAVEEVKG